MIGDALMSLPFIRAALMRFDVHVACAPATVDVFALVLPNDHIHPWHPPWLEANANHEPPPWSHSGLREYLRALKSLAPEIAVSVWADARVHYLMARCGARSRIGFPMTRQNYYAYQLPWRRRQLRAGKIIGLLGSILHGSPQLTHPIFKKGRDQHHVECWRQIAGALSLSWDETTPWFNPPNSPLPATISAVIADAKKAGKPIWIIHAGARVSIQRWPLSNFSEMVRSEIIPNGAQPVLLDSPEVQWPEEMRAQFPCVRLESFDQLIALFNAADGLLCNDTGVSHLAAALGKSVLAVFLTSNPNWFAPRGPKARWVANDNCTRSPTIGERPHPDQSKTLPDLRPRVRMTLREMIGAPALPAPAAHSTNTPLRVLIDAHMVGERETGNETYIIHLIRALRELDEEIEIIAAVAHPDAAEAALGPPDATCHYHRVSDSPWKRLSWELPRLARREKADLLHVTYTGPFGAGCPTVVSVHDVAYRVNPTWFSPRDRRVLAFGIGLTVRRAARVITISEHARSEILRFLKLPGEQVIVTLLAASPVYRRLPDEQITSFDFQKLGIRGPYALAVGNLQPRKNLLRLVEAFAEAIQRAPLPHQLVLVGKAQWRESEVVTLIEKLGLSDRVLFTGYVSDEDLVTLYNNASLFAYPSLYEGFGLPVLEAMACGAPVLTSTAASIPEVAGDAAIMVDPYDTHAIASGLIEILGDPATQSRLRKSGLQQARRFTWRATAEATLAIYRAAAKQQSVTSSGMDRTR